MPEGWISLPRDWELADVQAGTTLLINLFSAVGIWVVSYTMWKASAVRVVKSADPDLLSLISINGLGDVMNTLQLLGSTLRFGLIGRVLGQCLIVVALSTTSILAGPIARVSTQPGTIVQQQLTNGWSANDNAASQAVAFVQWNATIERLTMAGFPDNQIPDFLPDNSVDWKYMESEWNPTWTTTCTYTPPTNIPNVTATGNSSGTAMDVFPRLKSIFPPEVFTGETWKVGDTYSFKSLYGTETVDNVFLWVIAYTPSFPPYDNATGVYLDLEYRLSIMCFNLKGVPAVQANITNSTSNFSVGLVQDAFYTALNCSMLPTSGLSNFTNETLASSWDPWNTDLDPLLDAYRVYYLSQFFREDFTHQSITLPTGQDIFKFYQAYQVGKNSQTETPMQRTISVVLPTTELSISAFAVFLLYLTMLTISLLCSVTVWRLPYGVSLPMTKVEWVLQLVREVGGRDVGAQYFQMPWRALGGELRGMVYGRHGTSLSTEGLPYRSCQLGPKITEEPEPYASQLTSNPST